MDEKRLNTIIGNSLDFKYKIPDMTSMSGFSSPKIFDGIGVYKYNNDAWPVYWEAKYLKEPKSFPMSRFEDHQCSNLKIIQDLLGKKALCVLLIGVSFGRGDLRVYYYDDMHALESRKLNKQNILKKEFEASINYVKVKNGKIDFLEILKRLHYVL